MTEDAGPSSPVLAFAHLYADLGFATLPLRPASKSPDLPSWKEYQKRRPTEEELGRWFANGRHGIAIITGEVSGGLMAIDFDDRTAFEYCFTEWREMAKEALAVRTSRGVHLYIKLKGGGKPRKSTLRRKPDSSPSTPYLPVDIQGEGSYVVAPPSVHPNGAVYAFLGDGRVPIEDTEDAVVSRLKRHAEEWPFVEAVLPLWKEGNRNSLTLGLAKVLYFTRGFNEDRTVDVVRRICSVSGDLEVSARIRSVRDTISKGPERTAALRYLGEDLYAKVTRLLPRAAQRRPGRPESADAPDFMSFVELANGSLAEEIETPEGARFLVFDSASGALTVVPELEIEGRRVLPLPLPRDPKQPNRKILMLADGAEEYGTVTGLLDEMENLVLEVYDPGKDLPVLKLWIMVALTSWIVGPLFVDSPEKFASILAAIGPSESGKGRLLTVMRLLFYRPFLFLKTIRVASLFRALDGWLEATLMLNEADQRLSTEAEEFIEYVNARTDGSPITRYSAENDTNRYWSSFGHTIVALRHAYDDDGFNSRTLPLRTETTYKDLDLIASPEWARRTEVIRRKLLLFRLRQIARIRRGELQLVTKVDLPNVQSYRVKESFLALASLSKVEGPELIERYSATAAELQKRLVVARSASRDGLIIGTVYSFLADPEWSVVPSGTGHRLERHLKVEDEPEVQPLTLRRVSEALGNAFSSSKVASVWRAFGQEVEAQAKVENHKFRGVLVVQDPARLDREFKRFVVDPLPQAGRFAIQTKLGEDEA